MTGALWLMLRHWRLMVLTLWIAGLGLTVAVQQRALAAQGGELVRARREVLACQDRTRAIAGQMAALIRREQASRRAETLSAAEAAGACEARLAAARRQAGAIEALVRGAPHIDPSGCPARDLLDGEDLDAVFPSR